MTEAPVAALRQPRSVRVSGAGATDVGRVSDHDDDTTLVRPDLHLFLAADGAGGHAAGNVASGLAATSVAEFLELTAGVAATRAEIDAFGFYRDARRLATAIQHANRKIMKAGEETAAHKGMGTTVVAMMFSPGSGIVHLAHVGDSRCYRLREGVFELLTFDHSLWHDILELRPDIEDAALARLPPNVLTRALGMEDGVRVSVRTLEVEPGDRYVLCSDGLTDAIEPERIASKLALPSAPDVIVKALIDAANDAGGPDNISSVVILCERDDEGSPFVQPLPLPRPRRKRARLAAAPPTPVQPDDLPDIVFDDDDAGPEVSASEDDDDGADISIEEGEADAAELVASAEASVEVAPDLEWDESAEDGPEVTAVVDELFAMNTRLGAAIDRAAGRTTAEAPEVARCVACTAAIETDANFCGFCGACQTAAES